MRLLQPDLQSTDTLSVRFMEFHGERSCFSSLDSRSVQLRSESAMHHVMAYPRSRRRHSYVVISRHKELHHEHDRSAV